MKNRFVVGILAIVLGTFGVHKFYLGRKFEGALCLGFFWAGFPTLLGIYEGIWFLTKTENDWRAYLKALKNPKWYEEADLVRPYIYPIAIYSFLVSAGLAGSLPSARYLCLIAIPAIWFYPGKGEQIFENRITRPGKYFGRSFGTVVAALFAWAFITLGGYAAPNIELLSETSVSQSGGLYEARFRVGGADRVVIAGKDFQANPKGGEYVATLELKDRVTEIPVHAESHGLATDKHFSITRELNDKELAAIRERERQEADAEAELLEKQRLEKEKCERNAKCRAQKEEELKKQELAAQDAANKAQLAAKDEASAKWIADGNKFMPLVICEKAVTDRLKAPSTAEFASGHESNTAVSGGYIWVSSYVDAQNGFGAQIRSKFICQLELRGGDLYAVDISIF